MSMLMKRGNQNWIPSIFNDFFNSDVLVRNNATAPAINVFETEKEYKVEVAAAGMRREDFKIHVDNDNDLTITMERNCNCCDEKKECKEDGEKCKDEKCKDDDCDCKGRYLRREFSYTKFQQTLILPDDVDTGKITAKVKHGVLRIDIPKRETKSDPKISRNIVIE